jgi:hypothetical protein
MEIRFKIQSTKHYFILIPILGSLILSFLSLQLTYEDPANSVFLAFALSPSNVCPDDLIVPCEDENDGCENTTIVGHCENEDCWDIEYMHCDGFSHTFNNATGAINRAIESIRDNDTQQALEYLESANWTITNFATTLENASETIMYRTGPTNNSLANQSDSVI